MKVLGIAMVAALALAGTANRSEALPACGGGTDVMSYNGGGGCEVDGLVFSQFKVTDAGNPDAELVNAVNAQVEDGTVYFTFNPNLALAGRSQDIHFFFKVASIGGGAIITGVDLSNAGTGNTSISEQLCKVAFNISNLCAGAGNSLGAMLAGSGGEDDITFANPVSSAYVFKDIFKGLAVPDVVAEGHLTSFTQSFHTAVPEPASLLLLGTGLAVAARARRRATTSKA